MKSHRIEKILFIVSIISFVIFIASIPFGIFDNPFLVLNILARLLYTCGSAIALFVIIIILIIRHKRGYKKPLRIEAMRTAKAELPNKIYKFCSLSTGNTKENKELDEKKLYSLENNYIWMSDCTALNDPFEGLYAFLAPDIDKNKNEYTAKLINKIINERDMYIQSSFSYNCDNILMWGHYANGCRGYCIEYKVAEKDFLFPVQYINKRPLLSSVTNDKNVIENLCAVRTTLDKCKDDQEIINYMLYIQSMKSDIWSYEKEIRIIDFGMAEANKKCGNVDSEQYGLYISKIIVGYQCVYKNELIEIAKELNIPVSIMEISLNSKEYKLTEKEME